MTGWSLVVLFGAVVLPVVVFSQGFEVVAITNHTQISSGQSIGLSCVIFYQSNANISSVVWSKDEEEIANSSTITILEIDKIIEGRQFRYSILYLCNSNMANSGNYTCSVSNGTIQRQGQVELSVEDVFAGFEVVAISNHTQISSGQSIGLSCMIFYQRYVNISSVVWSKEDKEIANSSTITILEIDKTINGQLFRHSILYLCNLNMANSGNYTCSVSNGAIQRQEQVELTVEDSNLFPESLELSSTVIIVIIVCSGVGAPCCICCIWLVLVACCCTLVRRTTRKKEASSRERQFTLSEKSLTVEGNDYVKEPLDDKSKLVDENLLF